MPKYFIIALVILSTSAMAQDITGQWNGMLKVQGIQLRLVFHISKTENGYTATMDSPDQGANGIPVTKTTFENNQLTLEVSNAMIEYKGELKDNSISGTFKQGALAVPMDLSRTETISEKPKRPQEPLKPYPYYTEDVTFENKAAGITLSGTLTLPAQDGIYPVVILISGSGPQNRDEELLGHKPFLILSDHLTRNGIGVLRYDDRGTAQSTGNFSIATTDDFSTDALSAVQYLKSRKEVNKKKIGLIGHSEGGIIAPIVASQSKDVSFIVLMAGTGIPGNELLLLQQELIGRASGISEEDLKIAHTINEEIFDLVLKTDNSDSLKKKINRFLVEWINQLPEDKKPGDSEALITQQVAQITSPWMIHFIRYNPSLILKNVKCSVLAINGSKDLQVPPKENLNAIKKGLEMGGNKKVTTIELPGLNHLFQECETGAPSEYATIEQTISPIALNEIMQWIKTRI